MGAQTARGLGRAALGAVALVVLPASRAGASEATISVSPDAHLEDGQLVTVTGTGLEEPCVEGEGCFPVGILQCVRDAPLTISTFDEFCLFLGNAEQTGHGYRARVHVHEPFTPQRPGSSSVTCGTDGCDVVAGGIAGQFTFLTAPVSFSK